MNPDILEIREREVRDGAQTGLFGVSAHPGATKDVLRGEFGGVSWGFELQLLAHVLTNRLKITRSWPGHGHLRRYDFLAAQVSAVILPLADRAIVLGFARTPEGNA